MPKKLFWPLTIAILGLIFLASNMGMLPRQFANLWPLMFIVVGLGGLLTADRDEWLVDSSTKKSTKTSAKTAEKATKTTKRAASTASAAKKTTRSAKKSTKKAKK